MANTDLDINKPIEFSNSIILMKTNAFNKVKKKSQIE